MSTSSSRSSPGWAPDDHDGVLHRTWADSLATALVPSALPSAFPGLRAPGDGNRIAHAYGDNPGRLLAAKTRYAPDGVFAATPPPTSPARPDDRRPDSLSPA